MKKRMFLAPLAFLLAMPFSPAIAQMPYDDVGVSSINVVSPHANVVPKSPSSSISLNGVWGFVFASAPQLLSDSIAGEGFPLADIGRIRVPGNMELQGYGVPIYVNVRNEFPSNPPHPPSDYNPTGFYLRDVDIPDDWAGQRIFLSFGAVKSAMFLYVNGRLAGYHEDAKTPAEWEITEYLHPGRNRIAAKVLRWSDGSYLECQDMWRMSGITRDVTLYAVPQDYIKDYSVVADYRDGKGLLKVVVRVQRSAGQSTSPTVALAGASVRHVGDSLFLDTLSQVVPWSPETPNLYPLQITYGAHVVSTYVGFRSVEIKGGLLCLNGSPVTIKGVNRHEHSPRTGHCISREEMRQDAAMMKLCGINAVRTSHYPSDPYWYSLCDSMGLMVWDEANCESHAQGYEAGSLAKKPEWAEAIWNRTRNMVLRDRNHPCVLAWSLGNESGNGICFEEAYRRAKALDPTRPVVYERALTDSNTDIVGVMYPSVDYLSQYARGEEQKPAGERRPYVAAEYCHAMGNGCGGLSDYWDTIDKYPCLQGGFVWDWADQSFPLVDPATGKVFEGLGGDLGSYADIPGLGEEWQGIGNDDDFCANGLVSSRRVPHGAFYEVSTVYGGSGDTLAGMAGAASVPRPGGDAKAEDFASARLHLWRPPTQNDLYDPNGAPAWDVLQSLRWKQVSKRKCGTATLTCYELSAWDGPAMQVQEWRQKLEGGAWLLSYRVKPNGVARTLPRVGLQLRLPRGLAAEWLGKDKPTYPDRDKAGRLRLCRHAADSLFENYAVPQENGSYEARWLRIGGKYVTSDRPFHFSARCYEDSVLARARRQNQLVQGDHLVLNLDAFQAGLGTATCGPGVREQYTLCGDSVYEFCFLFGDSLNYPVKPCIPAMEQASVAPLPLALVAHPLPAPPYDKASASDGRRAVPGEYGQGWLGWSGADTLLLEVYPKKEGSRRVASLSLGACQAYGDWVLPPERVDVQVNGRGKWLPMPLMNPSRGAGEKKRLVYRRDFRRREWRQLRSARIRVVASPLLPVGHPAAGEKAWLLIDEVEVR